MKTLTLIFVTLVALTITTFAANGGTEADSSLHDVPKVTLLASNLGLLLGTTVGPDGALYVAESDTGRILRVDPQNGDVSVFASGLPHRPGFLGASDVLFLGHTGYVLVTEADPTVGGNSVSGIYRVDGPSSFTVIADIGQFAIAHPPHTDFFEPTGVYFALDSYGGDFIVTDGHHNRVYRVTLSGQISELIAFNDIVPTGLAVQGKTIYMAEAGPVPHLPENGKIVAFTPGVTSAFEIASGAPLLVDVEFGADDRLYALSQGTLPAGGQPGDPASPNTGSLVSVTRQGTLQAVVTGLNDPTSFDFIGNSAYVATLAGEIWKVRLQPARRNFNNMSARGNIGTGDNVLIGGFIVGGDSESRVLVRAIGPSLAGSGVNGAISDTTLDLYNANGAVIASNDDWRSNQQPDIEGTMLAPKNDRESAVLVSLNPGSYTAVVRGKGGATGVALVEFYQLN